MPHGLAATVTGSMVVLAWQAPTTSAVQYVVEAGSAPGAANLARLVTPDGTPSLIAQGVPNGVYYVRVRAVTTGGIGDASSDVSFIVGGVGIGASRAPGGCVTELLAPSALRATVVANVVRLTWIAPSNGCAATGYVLYAGSRPGLSDLAEITVGAPMLVASAPPGTYYVRVVSLAAGVTSVASNEIVVSVTP